MMARTHVATAEAAWFTVGAVVPQWVGHPLTPHQLAAGGVLVVGAGLLPDIDSPKSTWRYALGPVGLPLTRWVERISGGHRHATHTLAFVLAAGVVSLLLLTNVFGLVVAGAVSGMLATRYFAPRLVRSSMPQPAKLAVAGLLAALVVTAGAGPWVAWAFVVGVLAHLAGDVVTASGVPLLWPVLPERISLPVLPIESRSERVVMWGLIGVAVWAAYGHFAADASAFGMA